MNGVFQLLGLARRARRVAAGHEAAERALAAGRAALVILAEDASEGTRRRFAAHAAGKGVPVRVWGRMETLGRAIGSAPRAVLAVCDRGLAARLVELLDGGSGTGGPPPQAAGGPGDADLPSPRR